jgi:hypothetical protein
VAEAWCGGRRCSVGPFYRRPGGGREEGRQRRRASHAGGDGANGDGMARVGEGVRGRLGYSGGEVAEAGARVNGEETGRAVVGGERAGEGMGGTRELTSGPGLSAEERREREREGAADGWGRAVKRGAGARSWAAWATRGEGGSGRGRDLGWKRPSRGGERKCFSFSFSVFYFSFLFFYFYFLFISFSFEQQFAN